MAITIKSPYSGKLVKVRDADIGRSLRDGDGKIFFVLPASSGEGYYAAKTRVGSWQEEKDYDNLAPVSENQSESQESSEQNVYDATGKKTRPRLLVIIIVLIILAAIAFLCYSWALNELPFYNPKEQPAQKSSQVQKQTNVIPIYVRRRGYQTENATKCTEEESHAKLVKAQRKKKI